MAPPVLTTLPAALQVNSTSALQPTVANVLAGSAPSGAPTPTAAGHFGQTTGTTALYSTSVGSLTRATNYTVRACLA